VDCTEVGIGIRVQPHSTTPDHGKIAELKATVIQRGGWSEEVRSLALYVNTGGSGEYIVDDLDVTIPLLKDGKSSVFAIEGVRNAKITMGRITGGFST